MTNDKLLGDIGAQAVIEQFPFGDITMIIDPENDFYENDEPLRTAFAKAIREVLQKEAK